MKKLIQLKNKENEKLDPINKNYEQRISNLEGIVLFETASTNEDFTLSQPFSNFTYIEIYFHSVLGYRNSVKVLSNASNIPLITKYLNSGRSETVACTLTIIDKNVYMENFYVENNGTISDVTNKYIYVDKVIGYK